MLRVLVDIEEMNIEVDFEVWDGARYEVVLGMAWP
jgi:hypothetical protein